MASVKLWIAYLLSSAHLAVITLPFIGDPSVMEGMHVLPIYFKHRTIVFDRLTKLLQLSVAKCPVVQTLHLLRVRVDQA